jgi:hypothetical protein
MRLQVSIFQVLLDETPILVPNKTNHLDWENTPQSPELVYSISSIMGL